MNDRRRVPTLAAVLAISLGVAPAALPLAADTASLRTTVGYLASPGLEGRLTGSGGEAEAARFLVERLQALGAVPLPGQSGLLLPFGFTAGARDAGSRLELGGAVERVFSAPDDIAALSFSDSGRASGELVFAGYGLVVPESQEVGYDSYAGLDVEGKVVLVLRYFPEEAPSEVRGVLARYSGLRYKALQARRRGAAALLVLTGPRSPNAGLTVPMSFDAAISGSGILAASISGEAGKTLFVAAGRELEKVQAELDSGNPHVAGFEMPGLEVTLDLAVERQQREGHNVVGVLTSPAASKNANSERPDRRWIVLGAHYDHLGRGRNGNSLARKGEEAEVHPGADDNASGVAAVLEAAEVLRQDAAETPWARGIVVAFWSGEELGVLGSTAFVREELLAPETIAAYINLDMVGRVRDNRLTVQGVGSSGAWPALLERANVPVGFDLQLQEDPYLPTDSSSFNQAKVPTLSLFTGGHEDYHRPTDTPERLSYEGLARVARLTTLLAERLATVEEAPDFVRVAPRQDAGGGRDTVRAYTGTIPDYTTEVEGLRLAGVVGGGPAEAAGLQEGDVIIELADLEIRNIYDYTYALDAVKVGVPVRVVFLRAGERMEATITPRARR